MTKATPDEATKESVATEDVAVLTLQLEQLKTERDYLLAHSRNLEDELRHVAREPARVRELERRLAEAEARLRLVSFVHAGRRLVLEPDATLLRIYRRLRDGVVWLTRERYRLLRLKLRRFKA